MLVILVIREFNCLAKSICTYPLSISCVHFFFTLCVLLVLCDQFISFA